MRRQIVGQQRAEYRRRRESVAVFERVDQARQGIRVKVGNTHRIKGRRPFETTGAMPPGKHWSATAPAGIFQPGQGVAATAA